MHGDKHRSAEWLDASFPRTFALSRAGSLCCANAPSEGEAGGRTAGWLAGRKLHMRFCRQGTAKSKERRLERPGPFFFRPCSTQVRVEQSADVPEWGTQGARRVPTRSERWPRSRVGHAHRSCAAVPSAVRCCCRPSKRDPPLLPGTSTPSPPSHRTASERQFTCTVIALLSFCYCLLTSVKSHFDFGRPVYQSDRQFWWVDERKNASHLTSPASAPA